MFLKEDQFVQPAIIRRLYIILITPVDRTRTQASILNSETIQDVPTKSIIKESFAIDN